MSTRAVYTFKDDNGEYHVYKHHDGYPVGAAEFISNAMPYAWPLPRFEACEFGAAFIAGNKDGAGGVYMTTHWKDHGDLDYRYEITCQNGVIHIKAFTVTVNCEEIFDGTLNDFCMQAMALQQIN